MSEMHKNSGAGVRPARVVLAGVLLVLVVIGVVASWLDEPTGLLRASVLIILFGLFRRFCMKRISSPTPSGAIVMAIGIFINGALAVFPQIASRARSLALALFGILVFIIYSYLRELWKGELFRKHFVSPVASFAVGTWVAAISVCSIAVAQRVPEWLPFVKVLVGLNVAIWAFYVFNALRQFQVLLAAEHARSVHGVLLLSTVATQSIVIAARVAFGRPSWYVAIAPWFIGLGVVFYGISFVLIARRYVLNRGHTDLDTGWFNTNCIVHGAMSITGLASAVSGVVAPNVVLAIWLWVIAWFVIVEVIEMARAVVRVRRHGLPGGLFVYDPTQWSRNFTFGMFYAFTASFGIERSAAAGTLLAGMRELVLTYFGWVVLILLVIEGLIFLADRLEFRTVVA